MCKQGDAGHAENGRTSAGNIFTVCPAANPKTTIV
jgi:hypothetical protein